VGDRGVIVSRVGDDEPGQQMRSFLAERGVDTTYLQTDFDAPTGTVDVAFVDGEPQYTIAEDVAWDRIRFDDDLAGLATSCNAVCYESLAQRSPETREAMLRFLRLTGPDALRIFDVNLRPPFVNEEVLLESLRLAHIVKMNRAERTALSDLFGAEDVEKWITGELDTRLVCVTLGSEGCSLYDGARHVERPAEPVDTSDGDFVGVGDALVAALAHALVRRWSPETSLEFANRYAALVATRRGGMPEFADTELAEFRQQ